MIVVVQATFPDLATAERIGRDLVEARLAACANILGGCRSIYCWRGEIEQADEVVAQFKTTPLRVRRLVEHLSALHPYDLPAVEWWEAQAAPDVRKWVANETA